MKSTLKHIFTDPGNPLSLPHELWITMTPAGRLLLLVPIVVFTYIVFLVSLPLVPFVYLWVVNEDYIEKAEKWLVGLFFKKNA